MLRAKRKTAPNQMRMTTLRRMKVRTARRRPQNLVGRRRDVRREGCSVSSRR
jgi:hypothetical protein